MKLARLGVERNQRQAFGAELVAFDLNMNRPLLEGMEASISRQW